MLVGAGLGLAARGATNLPLARLAGIARGRRAIDLDRTLHLAAAPEALYDLWTDWENLPRFISHVRDVRDDGDGRTHWVVAGPGATRLEWDAVVTRAIRPQLLSWQTEPGSLVRHAGTVRLEPVGEGTRVSVKMSYSATGREGHPLATLLGRDPGRQMDDDLVRMMELIDQRQPPRDATRADDSSRSHLH
jgi:uncharacterized membrane protein